LRNVGDASFGIIAPSSELDLRVPAADEIDRRDPKPVEFEPPGLGAGSISKTANELVRRAGAAPDLAAEDAREDWTLDGRGRPRGVVCERLAGSNTTRPEWTRSISAAPARGR
jgi:hypothetical protein